MAPKPSNPPKIQDQLPSGAPPPPSFPQSLPYPVSSSGRGFIPKNLRPPQPQSTDQLVTVANSGGIPSRPNLVMPEYTRRYFSPFNPHVHFMDPPSQIGSRPMGTAVTLPPGLRPKDAPFPSASSDFNGSSDIRDKNRDDAFVTVNDRKVGLADGASLYALCRSWVRNGLPQESQPQIGEGIKLLPRPLPAASADTDMSKRNGSGDADGDEEKEEDGGSVEHLSPNELLQRHVKHARKVRARLREERLQRIERYKQRLALLLPSPVEHFRNDTAPGG